MKRTRDKAIENLPSLLKEEGQLLIICRGRDKSESKGDMPWPLMISDLEYLDTKLELINFEDYLDKHETPEVRRFRVLYKMK